MNESALAIGKPQDDKMFKKLCAEWADAQAQEFRDKGASEPWIQRYIYGKWDLEK